MSKIFNYYENNIDHTWYDSSNIVYSECIDNPNDYKTLKVVFKNGTQYQYDNLDVNDYILFREAASQGKELNSRIKSKNYPYKKLNDADLELINEDLAFRTQNGILIEDSNSILTVRNKSNEILYSADFSVEDFDVAKCVEEILKSVGFATKIINKDLVL